MRIPTFDTQNTCEISNTVVSGTEQEHTIYFELRIHLEWKATPSGRQLKMHSPSTIKKNKGQRFSTVRLSHCQFIAICCSVLHCLLSL